MTYQYIYFIDRALGKSVGQALQSIGVNIEFHIDKIEKITKGNKAPFIAKISRPSQVAIWKNKTKLNKLLKS